MPRKKKSSNQELRVIDMAREDALRYGFRGDKSVEVLRLKPQIMEALAGGYTRKLIWRALRSRGLIVIGYDRFRILCTDNGMARRRSRGSKRTSTSGRNLKSERANYPWTPDLKEIYGDENDGE